jgi:ubiquinone/menaquinone biosynthesis C-methylase UbiE
MQLVGLSALEYDEQYYAEHKDANLDYLGHGYWQEEYAKMVSKGLPQGSIVFDGGCACGSILNGFKKLGFKTIGMDVSKYMIDIGKNHFNYADNELICGSLTDIPFPDNSVDLVHSAQVLEHIPQGMMNKIISEFERILKPGGRMFLCLDAVRDGETKDMYMGDPTHVNIQPIEYWAKLIKKGNLLFDVQRYNDFVRSEYRPTKEVETNFFEAYPYWSVFTLIKE